MAIIKCKMCGGDIQLAEDKTFGTCEYCGCTMTFPKVSDEQRAAAFNRGNHFRRIGEFDKALAVYERIVAEDDADAEAHWCCALCRFGIEYVEDPATYEWLPTCHRASFDSFLEDVDYLAAVEHSDGITRRQYQKDAAKIAEVQRGILATSQNTEPYDVFISYKELDADGNRTRDSILAQEVYYRLTEKGWRVFFSRISLEDVPGTQYEPYIFAALNSAKVMIVVGTSAENLNAVWVKNEWSRYLSLMRKDRSKLLIPCYRDMDPYDLPEQLAVLMSYDMGKIGFIQDLIRGIDKVLSAEKPKESAAPAPAQERVIVQQSGGGPNVTAMLKRGQQALEDGDWDKAEAFFDQVLNMDAENAEAFLGLFLAGEKCVDESAYIERACAKKGAAETLSIPTAPDRINAAVSKNKLDRYLMEYDLRKLFEYDMRYSTTLRMQKQISGQEKASFQSNRDLKRAFHYAKGEVADRLNGFKTQLFAGLDRNVEQAKEQENTARKAKLAAYEAFLTKAENIAQERNAQAQERKQEDYLDICQRIETATKLTAFNNLKSELEQRFSDYKDSAEQIENCNERIAAIEKETAAKAEAERQRKEAAAKAAAEEAERQRFFSEKAAAEKKAKQKKTGIIVGVIAVLAIAAVIVVTRVIIPNNQYKAAEVLLKAGKYEEAAIAYGKAKTIKDAREQSRTLWNKVVHWDTISAGYLHTVGLRTDSTVVASSFIGNNNYNHGQCDVSNWKDIVAVAAGGAHTLGLRSNGTVVAAGLNNNNQCNVSNWTDIVAIATGHIHSVGIGINGKMIATGDNKYGQCDVSGWVDIVAVSAGDYHTVGLRSDGTVIATGDNKYGQCDVSGWVDIVAVAAGGSYTVGLRSNGTVIATGLNNNDQCNVSNWTDIVAVATGDRHTVGLRSDGTVVAVGANGNGRCDVSDWTDIVAIAAGGAHTAGLRSDGTVIATGYNEDGQCNVRDWTDIRIPKR